GSTMTAHIALTSNVFDLTVKSVKLRLGKDLTYVPGSSSGLGGAQPTLIARGTVLTWKGPFLVAAGQTRTLDLGVAVGGRFIPGTKGIRTSSVTAILSQPPRGLLKKDANAFRMIVRPPC